jgi:hypothetical protein
MWLVGFRYVFGKNYGWGLCVAKNIYKMFGSCVWKCGCDCFSKCFLLGNASKYFFYFLKIIFDISASKWSENTKKILIWSKKNKQF